MVEFIFPVPMDKAWVVMHAEAETGDSLRLTEQQAYPQQWAPDSVKDNVSKYKVDINWERHLTSTSNLHTHAHMFMGTHMHIYTHTTMTSHYHLLQQLNFSIQETKAEQAPISDQLRTT